MEHNPFQAKEDLSAKLDYYNEVNGLNKKGLKIMRYKIEILKDDLEKFYLEKQAMELDNEIETNRNFIKHTADEMARIREMIAAEAKEMMTLFKPLVKETKKRLETDLQFRQLLNDKEKAILQAICDKYNSGFKDDQEKIMAFRRIKATLAAVKLPPKSAIVKANPLLKVT